MRASFAAWRIAFISLVALLASFAPAAAGPPDAPLRLDAGASGDLLLYNPDVGLWFNANFSTTGAFTYTGGPQWPVGFAAYPARLNNDDLSDVFLYNRTTGAYAWAINTGAGYTVTAGAVNWSPGWQVQVADFNDDRLHDLLLYNTQSGVWFQCVNTGALSFTYTSGTWAPNLTVVLGRFNLDDRTDVFTYAKATGTWQQYLTNSTGSGFGTPRTGAWSPNWNIYAGSFNSDELTDLFLYDPAAGFWFQCLSTGTATAFSYEAGQWSPRWQIHPGDLNGDSVTDLFLYDPQTGIWFECISNGGGATGFTYASGTWSTDWSVWITDFDADGSSDVFLYSRQYGLFFQCLNRGAGQFAFVSGAWSPNWTIVTDMPALPSAVIISAILPVSGPTTGGTPVTIEGAGFNAETTVTLGGMAPTTLSVVDSHRIVIVTPAHLPGAVNVTVASHGGVTTVFGGFSYVAARIDSLTPASGPTSGGTTVTITGANFSSPATVRFNGAAASGVVVVSHTTIRATTPAHAAGSVDVTVDAPGGTATLFNGYTYLSPGPTVPTLTTPTILAFGDSITWGTDGNAPRPAPQVGAPYPSRLRQLLQALYPSQTITVINEGLPGESTNNGRNRIKTKLDLYRPDLVLILEGVNDLNIGFTPESVEANLRSMVQSAQARNVQVLIARLTPVLESRDPDGTVRPAVLDVNNRIKTIAADFGIGPTVNLFDALGGAGGSLIGSDGLHPAQQGYNVIANTFRDAIVSRFVR